MEARVIEKNQFRYMLSYKVVYQIYPALIIHLLHYAQSLVSHIDES